MEVLKAAGALARKVDTRGTVMDFRHRLLRGREGGREGGMPALMDPLELGLLKISQPVICYSHPPLAFYSQCLKHLFCVRYCLRI